ncbi:conserved exported hypothetical protein [uncultured Defluviicoccus sp.]|uniref:Uncharacterized protein n=1 Tax=metagenome TaxID=256318 RepID=A0A380THK3_9ZZZZ|nr:conserved exported hypothetical protein [uncultured Defluviicoccus sp.]
MRTLPMRRQVVLGALLLPLIAAPVQAEPALTDSVIDQRLAFIVERLDARATHGQIWHWSWMTINAGSAIGLGIVAGLADHEDDAVNNAVQAGVAAIGVADLVFRPLEARYGAAPIRGLPETTRDEKLAKLKAAEEQLKRNAARAEERTSFSMHAANVALNAAAGLIIGLAGNPSDGAIAFATGTAGGVVNILTQPAAPAQDWEDYQALVNRSSHRTEVLVFVSALPDGALLGMRLTW